MAVKIPLKMSDGTPVKTIEELREHFNLADVLGYYGNGRLVKWLTDWYYDEEAKRVKTLDSKSDGFQKELCDILGVGYSGKEAVNLEDVAKRNERLELLREYTTDDKILALVDRVVFNQEELDALLRGKDALEGDDDELGIYDFYDEQYEELGEESSNEVNVCADPLKATDEVVYLCGNYFTIPVVYGAYRKYIGVNKPTVEFDSKYGICGIDLQNVKFDISGYINEGHDFFDTYFRGSGALGIKLLHMAAEKKSVDGIEPVRVISEEESMNAQEILGWCYRYGFCIGDDEINAEEAVKWFRKAAEGGHAEAQYELGQYYCFGNGIGSKQEEARKYYQQAADQGHEGAREGLELLLSYESSKGLKEETAQDFEETEKGSFSSCGDDWISMNDGDNNSDVDWAAIMEQCEETADLGAGMEDKAFGWYKKGAMDGNASSQFYLGKCYYDGEGVEKNEKEAFKWFQRASEQGNVDAQYYIGKCYYYGEGVEEDEEEAIKWYRKAAKQGSAEAQYELGERYYYGRGVEEDEKKAEKWFRKAAEQGDVMAQIMLINNYQN